MPWSFGGDIGALAAGLTRSPGLLLGWEHVVPQSMRPYHELHPEPVLELPEGPDVRAWRADLDLRRRRALLLVTIIAVALTLGFAVVDPRSLTLATVLLVVFFLLALRVLLPVLAETYEISHREGDLRRATDELRRGHDERAAAWARDSEAHERTRRREQTSTPLLYPLLMRSNPPRIDVFGGAPSDWSSLLCTLGPSILGQNSPMLVVDLTRADISAPLRAVAGALGLGAYRQVVPEQLEAARLLDGLPPPEVADLVAEAVASMSGRDGDIAARVEYERLVLAVAESLSGPVTFARIAAGLLVLQGRSAPGDQSELSPAEHQRLSARAAKVVTDDQVRYQARVLYSRLDMLRDQRPPRRGDAGAVPSGRDFANGVFVLRVRDLNRRRRDLVNRLLAQYLLQRVSRSAPGSERYTLVVAGAQQLGLPTLELLAAECHSAGVRLMLFLEHLRGDLTQLLGSAYSATFVMRLGNAQEARRAADHIGMVDPGEIQALGAEEFVFAEMSRGELLRVRGTCAPETALHPRVSRHPRRLNPGPGLTQLE